MLIKRVSPFSGKVNTMDIDITEEQLNHWFVHRPLIQDAFPNLKPHEREFLLTGHTQEDWDAIFGEEK